MVKCVVKFKKLSDWNKNWCGSRYGPHDYDSGDKKTKRQKDKKKDKKTGGPQCPPQELEQAGHRPPKFWYKHIY